jgi:hypothetical protein
MWTVTENLRSKVRIDKFNYLMLYLQMTRENAMRNDNVWGGGK